MRNTMAQIFRRVGARADSWLSTATGSGTSDDKLSTYKLVESQGLSDNFLEAAFVNESLAHRVVTALPADALRQGFTLTSDENPDQATELQLQLERKYNFIDKIQQICEESRLYGGIGLLLRVEDGEDWTEGAPLRRENVSRVYGMDIIRPKDLYVQEWGQDPMSERFGKPLHYRARIYMARVPSVIFEGLHYSRVMRVEHGIKLTQYIREYKNWGHPESVLQPVIDRIVEFRAALRSVASLFTDASQTVYKIRGLNSMLESPAGADFLRERFDSIDTFRSSIHSILLDSEGEDFQRIATPMAEMANLIDRFMLSLAEAGHMPVSRLFGQEPAGLNSTGEASTRGWYDEVQTYRERKVEPLAYELIEMLSADERLPDMPKDLRIEWPSLWQLSPLELAEVQNKVAQTDQAYIDSLVMSPEEVAEIRMQPEGWRKHIPMVEEENTSLDFEELEDAQNTIEQETGESEEEASEVRPPEAGGVTSEPVR